MGENSTTNDFALLGAARGCDPEVMGQIFDTYAPVLFRYAYHLCHDRLEADRVVGDVFFKLLDLMAEGKGPHTNLRSYLYQTAYHLLIDHVRQAGRVTSLDDVLHLSDDSLSVPMQAEAREIMRALQSEIKHSLTSEQRHVILLRFVEGFSLQETARITGKRVNAVSVLQNRALGKLRKGLARKFGTARDHEFWNEFAGLPA